MPVRTQTLENCFAFAAADLIGHRLRITPGRQISGIDVTVNYYLFDYRKAAEMIRPMMESTPKLAQAVERTGHATTYGGSAQAYLFFKGLPVSQRKAGSLGLVVGTYNFGGGLCFEDQLPSDDGKKSSSYLPNLLQGLEEEANRNISRISDPTQLRFGYDKMWEDRKTELVNRRSNEPCAASTIEQTIMPQIEDLALEINGLANMLVATELDKRCQPRTLAPPLLSTWHDVPSQFISIMNTSLGARPAKPIGMGFDASFLIKEKNIEPGKNHPHAGVIVGRHWNEGEKRCEFVMRNSWGPDCSIYRDTIQRRCKGGNLSLTEDEITGFGLELVTID